jgi:hypothetical protein
MCGLCQNQGDMELTKLLVDEGASIFHAAKVRIYHDVYIVVMLSWCALAGRQDCRAGSARCRPGGDRQVSARETTDRPCPIGVPNRRHQRQHMDRRAGATCVCLVSMQGCGDLVCGDRTPWTLALSRRPGWTQWWCTHPQTEHPRKTRRG